MSPDANVQPDATAGVPVVLDTQVWLDLLWFRDPRIAALQQAIERGQLQPLVRADAREEWLRVLGYTKLGIGPEAALALRSDFDQLTRELPDSAAPERLARLPRCHDPDDQKFLELALACGARWLFSRDQALLSVDRRMQRLCGCVIRSPIDFDPAAK